jgi:hypothetical protein
VIFQKEIKRGIMYKLVYLLLAGAAVVYCTEDVVNNYRDCPEGYFYAGEANHDALTRGEYWEKGPTSPVYSCYRFIQGNFTFSGASISCNEGKGQLVSINDDFEDLILTSKFFAQTIPSQISDEVRTTGVITSGIKLEANTWTWFGADEPVNESISEEIAASTDDKTVNCLTVRWEMRENGTELIYTAEPCTNTFNYSLCEVRVCTQVWYVWFYTNWLQVLFFFTMFMLLISLCCTFQMWSVQKTRTVVRTAHNSPPPYTPHPTTNTVNSANRYVEKGRDILAKVTFYKQSSGPEKQQLPRP